MVPSIQRFNVRVYGVVLRQGHLLVSDEVYKGHRLTKLPGGGVELGEGLAEALEREFKEELSLEIAVGEVCYTNPFFQKSAFRDDEQVIAIYFWVKLLEEIDYPTAITPDFPPKGTETWQQCRWIPLDALRPEIFTMPIDQKMVAYLLEEGA